MNTDEELMRELGRVLDAADNSQIPGMEAAKAALAWRNLDTELAQLVFDSRAEVLESEVVMRGHDPEARQLTFSTTEVTIDIEIGEVGLIGQIVPPQPASIELHQSGNKSVALEADEFGVFTVPNIDPGPTTVIARALDGSWSVRTAWQAT